MNKKILQWIIPAILFCVAVIVALWSKNIAQNEYNNELLSGIVYRLTVGYQVRQLATTLIIFLLGYFIVACLLPYNPIAYMGLSFPTGLAVWSFSSIVILACNITYCLPVMMIMIGSSFCIFLIWRKEYFKTINYLAAIRHALYIASFILIISAGFMPIITTYDSHIFIYQFGEMIANQGSICSEAVGACILATGINSALMVSLARFAGFETIQAFHWMLILSLVLCVFHHIKKVVNQQASKKKMIATAIIICCLLFGIPSFLYLIHMVNSCTYMMVFITIICLYSFDFSKDNRNSGWILISLFLVWLSFGRLESGVMAAFFIVCIGHLSISKKNMIIITIPMVLLQSSFLLRILSEKTFTALSTRENFLSASAVTVIFFSMIAVVFYVLFFENVLFKGIRQQLPELIIIGLIAACLLIGMYTSEKFVVNVLAVLHNLEIEYWKYFPHTAAIVLGGAIIYKKKLDWWDCILFGYALLNFVVCLGRELPLREGFGDSYNRILCSLVPLTFYVMIKRISEIRSKSSERGHL